MLDATSAILHKEKNNFKEIADGGRETDGMCMHVLHQGRNLVRVVSGAFLELKKLNIADGGDRMYHIYASCNHR